MSRTTGLVTAEELARLPDDDYRYELVEGRLVRMSPVGYSHSAVVSRLLTRLNEHLRSRALGIVHTELGFTLASNPDTVRAPDISFIRPERIPSTPPTGFWNGPPDLAIEVLSPDDRPGEVRQKVQEYLTHGVALVGVIDPNTRTATVWRSGATSTLSENDALDLEPVIPGFRCPLRDIFG